VLYRLGQHAPTGTTFTVAPVIPAAPAVAALAAATSTPTRRRVTAKTTASKPRGHKAAVPPPDISDLMPIGRQVHAEMRAAGTRLTRDSLSDALRAAGAGAGHRRVGALLAALRAEPDTAADAA
jgi:hypothetical protein